MALEDEIGAVRVTEYMSKGPHKNGGIVRIGSLVLVDDCGTYQEATVKRFKSHEVAVVVFRDDSLGELREIQTSKVTVIHDGD